MKKNKDWSRITGREVEDALKLYWIFTKKYSDRAIETIVLPKKNKHGYVLFTQKKLEV